MAQINDTTGFAEVLQEISDSGNPLLTMPRMICQEMMELEVNQQLNADRRQRIEGRTGNRSGYQDRRLDTRFGMLNLDVPRVHSGEIRRMTRKVGIFPNKASYVRLVYSYILEYTEDWAYERVYLSPESLRKMLEEETTEGQDTAV